MPKVLLIGPYCGKPGGVKVHMNRLLQLLNDDINFDIIDESKDGSSNVFNIRSGNILVYLKKLRGNEIIHIHSGKWWLIIIHIFWSKILLKKVIVTLHSNKVNNGKLRAKLFKYFLQKANVVVAVNTLISNELNLKSSIVRDAFIPPNGENTKIPEKYSFFFNHDKFIVSSNAYRLISYKNEDLYGLDLCITVAKLIKKNNEDIRIAFIIGDLNNSNIDMYNSYLKIIKEKNLSQYLFIIPEAISFISVIRKSNIIVRATNTDGDALTVREALFYQKPVIASNVVARPDNTILFENRNAEDLYQKIISVKKEYQRFVPQNNTADLLEIKNFYKNLYSNI